MADDRGMERWLASPWRWLLLPLWLLFRPLNWLRNLALTLACEPGQSRRTGDLCR